MLIFTAFPAHTGPVLQSIRPQTGARRWEKDAEKEVGGGEVGTVFSLKESAFQKTPHHNAIGVFNSRACQGGPGQQACVSPWKWTQGPLQAWLVLKTEGPWPAPPSLHGCSHEQVSEETACRSRPRNQPDIKTQRCNYYPLKLHMCETKKIFSLRAHKNPATAFVLNY